MNVTYVGIDVSKDWLDVHVHPAGDAFRVASDEDGAKALAARLQPVGAAIIAVEATGGLETRTVAALIEAGLPVVVVNPAQVRAYAQALGKRAKTDGIDAAVIARFAEATKPAIRPLPDAMTRQLGELLGRRRQIVAMIAADRQREHRATDAPLKKSIQRLRKAMEKELARIDAGIDDHIRASPVWMAKEALLAGVPGVGAVVARTLLAEMPELGQLGRREIAALAGLAPWTRQSGRWKGRTAVGGGGTVVRSMLFMAALSAARFNPPLKVFRDKLVAAGKSKLVAMIAVARKLLTILNAMLRTNTAWIEPEAQALA